MPRARSARREVASAGRTTSWSGFHRTAARFSAIVFPVFLALAIAYCLVRIVPAWNGAEVERTLVVPPHEAAAS